MTATKSPFRFAPPPTALSRFVGREREISTLESLLAAARLLTLTGAGGSGKTRLATETVLRVANRWQSIVWIDLASLADQGGLASHVAAGFGLTERGGKAALEGIKLAIGGNPTLLILDNCEHVIDGAARLAESLLKAVTPLSILATSREPLGVRGETAWLVPPLVGDEARNLFVERARSVQANFGVTPESGRTIDEICRRLDGIPLAIELAAARVTVLSLEQIAARLRDALRLLSAGQRAALPRHRTLRGTIEWSYGLLSEREQLLLHRLGVFPATFSLEAAEAITPGGPLDAGDVLDTLTGLVDKSLVVLDASETDARYRLLEIVRQFATELVAADDLAWLKRRHTEYYLGLAERIAPEIYGTALKLGLEVESANLRAAVEWAGESPDRAELGLRFVWALHWFWWARGPFREVQPLVKALDAQVSRLVRIRALIAFCQLGCWQGRLEEALRCGEQALELLAAGDDPELLAIALTMTAAARTLLGDYDGALADTGRAIPLGYRHSKTIIPGIALHFRAMALEATGDRDGAWAALAEEIEVLLSRGETGVCHPMTARAALALLRGDRAAALALFRESLALAAGIPDTWGVAKNIEGIAICSAPDDPVRAARLLGAAEAYRERIAHPMWMDERRRYDPAVADLRERLGAELARHWSAGRAMSEAEACREALGGAGESGRSAAVGSDSARRPHPEPVVPGTAPVADLAIRTLGRFEVTKRGQPIDASAWGSARPRELLVFLACHRDGVTRDQVGLAFWPDGSPSQVRNNFHVTMHRLRKTLGDSEWVTMSNERYSLSKFITVELDADLFEREVEAGLGSLERGDASGAGILASALARYQEPFLAGEPVGDWALDRRDRLNRRFVEGGIAHGRWLLDQERHDQALAALQAVTARDPLSEEAWALMMRSFARKGEAARALEVYQQLDAVFAADVDSGPGRSTVELRDRIGRGEPV